MHYLDHPAASPPPAHVVDAVRDAAGRFGVPGPKGATSLALSWMRLRDQAREKVAGLLDVDPGSVTLVESTTHGLGLLAAGLDLKPGDVVLVPDCEFVGLTAVWQSHARRGVVLRPLRSRAGAVCPDDIVEATDHRTRVIACSAIQEVTGAPTDLEAVATIAHEVGALLVVDGIHEAGVLSRSPGTSGIDAYVAGGHKWLRNPYGLGFLWTSDRLRERLSPPWQGYFALTEPRGGWEAFLQDRDHTAFDLTGFRSNAAGLEIGGTPNWLGAVALTAALDNLQATGLDQVEANALALADRLRAGLDHHPVAPLTSGGTRSPIVTFGLPAGDQAEQALHTRLREAGVHVSLRRVAGVGGIRAGCHGHNTADDVDALLDVSAAFPAVAVTWGSLGVRRR